LNNLFDAVVVCSCTTLACAEREGMLVLQKGHDDFYHEGHEEYEGKTKGFLTTENTEGTEEKKREKGKQS